MDLISFINIISLSLGTPPSINELGETKYVKEKDAVTFNELNSDDLDLNFQISDIDNSSIKQLKSYGKSDGKENGSVSDKIEETDLKAWLERNYDDYDWQKVNANTNTTLTTTNAKPIEMLSSDFSSNDIKNAINNAGLGSVTSYGGCGPIAMLGIFDYLSRYLGYSELIPDVYNASDRVDIATEVLQNSNIEKWKDSENQTISWPWYYAGCLDNVIKNHNLNGILKFGLFINYGIFTNYFKNIIESNFSYLLKSIDFGFAEKELLWDKIVESIDNGFPVTLFNGTFAGDGDFSGHYVNVYGYDTWVGYGKDRQTKTKKFLKARLNWDLPDEYYCDADILDCPTTGIFNYYISYSNSYSFDSFDFSTFVNDKGQGQYFFDTKTKTITLNNGIKIETERKRTSFIENEFLVLSPNRKNAGEAFLRIIFPHNISEISFCASLWGPTENALNEHFNVESIRKDTSFSETKSYLSMNAIYLPLSKYAPKKFKFVFSKKTNGISISAKDTAPYGDRNKGRICLNYFNVKYN